MFARTGNLIAGLFGAVLFCQSPELLQQYQQRLGGAVDELRAVTERFDLDATTAGLSRDEALARYVSSNDPFFEQRGISMRETITRFERLLVHRRAMAEATALERPLLFLREADQQVRSGTIASYRPAVPTTLEGAIYAIFGYLFGAGLLGGMRRLVRAVGRLLRPA